MCIIRPSIVGPFFQLSCSKSEYELTESWKVGSCWNHLPI